MSTIEMSPAFGLAYAQRIIGYPAALSNGINSFTPCPPANAPYLNKGSSPTAVNTFGELLIMKGAVPADFSTLVDRTSRSSDALCQFISNINDNFGPTNTTTNPCIIQTDFVAATASGLATWFWLRVKDYFNATIILQQLFGTIGAVGSGSDLEIPDTNLISGVPYRVTNLKLQFPTSWTY